VFADAQTVIEGHADRGSIAYTVAVVPRCLYSVRTPSRDRCARGRRFSLVTRGGLNFDPFSAFGAAVDQAAGPQIGLATMLRLSIRALRSNGHSLLLPPFPVDAIEGCCEFERLAP
jgi:hypothetical protein